jgi:histidine triad (HIT) family protein
MGECIFCHILEGKIPAEKVYEDDEIIAIKDINPQAPVHILIMPKQHIPSVLEFPEVDCHLQGKMMMAANKLAKENDLTESGFRLVYNCGEGAGQTVFHVHLHLLGGRDFRWPPG